MTDEPNTGDGETITLTKAELEAKIAEAVAPIKAKADELLGETKQERQKRQALEQAQAEAERKRAEEQGQFQELYKQTQAELEKERQAAQEYRQKVARATLEGEAGKIAAELSRDTARAALLAEQAAKFIKPGDNGLQYEIGGVQVDRAKALDHLRASFPFLVDGSQASGGGATGGNGGAVLQKRSAMNAKAKAAYIAEHGQAAYLKLPK